MPTKNFPWGKLQLTKIERENLVFLHPIQFSFMDVFLHKDEETGSF